MCAVLITFQNIIGVGVAKVTGLHPLLGLCAGSIPLVGGHGTSGAFGPMLEGIGVERATTVAIAMATFGLISGSLMGGPVAHRLLENSISTAPRKIWKGPMKSPEHGRKCHSDHDSGKLHAGYR